MYARRSTVSAYARQPGLGNPFAVGTVVNGIQSALKLFGLNSSDPVKDQQRGARIDRAFGLAMAGDTALQPDLNNMSGEAYLNLIAGNSSASGSVVARKYAQAKQIELAGRRGAGSVGGVLIGQSDIPARAQQALQSALTSPYLLGGAALAGLYLITRKKR